MFFEFGKLAAAIKAAQKLAIDKGVPYFVYGFIDKTHNGYLVETTLPPNTKYWTRAWPDGKTDSETRPRKDPPH